MSKCLIMWLCPVPHLTLLLPAKKSLILACVRPYASLIRAHVKISSQRNTHKRPGEYDTCNCSSNPSLRIKSNNSFFIKRVKCSQCSSFWKISIRKISIGFWNMWCDHESIWTSPAKDSNRISTSSINAESLERRRAFRAVAWLSSKCERKEHWKRKLESPEKEKFLQICAFYADVINGWSRRCFFSF